MLSRVVLSLMLLAGVNSARILGVFPMPSISHQVVFRALTLELAKRGHEMVIITPNPALPKDRPKDNVTEIDVGQSYEAMKNITGKSFGSIAKRGVITDVEAMISYEAVEGMFQVLSDIFKNEQVNKLLHDKSQKFDLVIVEALLNAHLIFGKVFDAPVILISSFYGLPEVFETIGAVTRHPIMHPNAFRNAFRDLTLYEKIREIYYEYQLAKVYRHIETKENILLRSIFGDDAPTIHELKNYVSLLLLNSFPIFDNNRPVPPSVIYMGALHLQAVKELPEDLNHYLDNSARGIIYVSLGTNVRPSMMAEDLLDAFLKAFELLPYDILWKFDGENLENVPRNVKVQKWFPQRDLLMHPKIKAFVTQAGLQSTDEAIDSGVPLVGIPMLADQWYNANKYVQLGFGIQLDGITLTSEELVTAVKRVIDDDSFRRNIKQVKALMYDQPQRPLERAVWWTEHILRHGGAKHLRAPAANISWSEYLMTDVVLVLASAFFVLVFVVISVFYHILSIIKSSVQLKVKHS